MPATKPAAFATGSRRGNWAKSPHSSPPATIKGANGRERRLDRGEIRGKLPKKQQDKGKGQQAGGSADAKRGGQIAGRPPGQAGEPPYSDTAEKPLSRRYIQTVRGEESARPSVALKERRKPRLRRYPGIGQKQNQSRQPQGVQAVAPATQQPAG